MAHMMTMTMTAIWVVGYVISLSSALNGGRCESLLLRHFWTHHYVLSPLAEAKSLMVTTSMAFLLLFICLLFSGSFSVSLPYSQEIRNAYNSDKSGSLFSDEGIKTILNQTDVEMFPSPDMQERVFNLSATRRRRLGEFHLCAVCTCCGGFHKLCIPTACCYNIRCGSPDRPFGICSFTPVACNCFGCRLRH